MRKNICREIVICLLYFAGIFTASSIYSIFCSAGIATALFIVAVATFYFGARKFSKYKILFIIAAYLCTVVGLMGMLVFFKGDAWTGMGITMTMIYFGILFTIIILLDLASCVITLIQNKCNVKDNAVNPENNK